MRERKAIDARQGWEGRDKVLDQLIRMGLIDHPTGSITPVINQVIRYSACMSGRLAFTQKDTYDQVGLSWEDHLVFC
jgi:hypothetical protein